MIKHLLTVLLLLVQLASFAQFLERKNITVYENGDSLINPWTGGMNACQFSDIDLNLDGIQDLFVFDRSGNRVLTYINQGISDSSSYLYAPEYIACFPKFDSWVLLVDYNCDGKKDIFCYSLAGASIYKNTSTTSLSFSLVTPKINADYHIDLNGDPVVPPSTAPIYISRVDIPAITDVDNDGDIDILTFKQFGGYVEYYENKSMDLYGNCDSIAYNLYDNCWGDFFEGLNVYSLSSCPTTPSAPKVTSGGAHTGSTLLAIDLDADTDKEIILGDVSFDNLNMLTNGGTLTDAVMNAVDPDFPANNNSTVAVDLNTFPAAFYVDINNDNVRDLLVSPNKDLNCSDHESNWLYINNNVDNNPDFKLTQENFLQDQTLDFGTGAHPITIDYNHDGLKDLLVGGHGYFQNGDYIAQLTLFENTGSATNPQFTLINEDFAGISNINLNTTLNLPVAGLYPTLGDLDNDGDEDLIVGDADGKLHLFENTAGAGNPHSFTLLTPNFENIDIGQYAAPVLYDLNQDSLLDLVIGKLSGDLIYAPNNGGLSSPVFDTLISNFGNVSVANYLGSYGYSKPYFYQDNGNTHLLVGSESGYLYHYNDIDNNLTGNFNVLDTTFHGIWDGIKTACLYTDFTNDGENDLLIGNQSGGLIYFQYDSTNTHTPNAHLGKLHIYPNPASHTVYVNAEGEKTIYNILGEVVLKTKEKGVNIQHLANGVYWIRCEKTVWKLIKQ